MGVTTHGMKDTRIYRLWGNMLSAIRNPKVARYKYTGALGISCDSRRFSFENFYNDLKDDLDIAEKKIQGRIGICRKDTTKDFTKDNVYFCGHKELCSQGKRDYIMWEGNRYTVYGLKDKLGISYYVAKRILDEGRNKEKFNEYLFNRVKKFKYKGKWYTARELANLIDAKVVTGKTIYDRIQKYGISVENAVFDGHRRKTSGLEDYVADFVESLGFTVYRQKHIGGSNPYDIDIFVKEKNLCIEFNGNYFHSFYKLLRKDNNGVLKPDYKYQNRKTKVIRKKYNFLVIWEDQWIHNNEIVKSIIMSKLGINNIIYARDTKINSISKKEYNTFCNKNHLQGSGRGGDVLLGLFYMGSLVSVMGFKKNELVRFCSLKKHTIVGGFSKLFKYFIKNYGNLYNSIFSFANLDIVDNDSNVYIKNGFKKVGSEVVDYFYFESRTKKRYHKSRWSRSKLEKKFGNIPTGYTERSFANEKGLYQCYFSGLQKYVYIL